MITKIIEFFVENWERGKEVFWKLVSAARVEEKPLVEDFDVVENDQDSSVPLDEDTEDLKEDKPKKTNKKFSILYALGMLGGLIAGACSYVGIIAYRIAIDSWEGIRHIFSLIVSKALGFEPDEVKAEDLGLIEEPKLHYGLGLPGTVIGAVIGAVVFIGAIIARILSNSYLTMESLTNSATNWVRHDNEPIGRGIEIDKRSGWRIYLFGILGLVVGIFVTAPLFMICAALIRGIIESCKTIWDLTFRIAAKATPFTPDDDYYERLNVDYYGFGGPGLFVGSLLGFVGFLFLGGVRVIVDILNIGARVYRGIANLIWAKQVSLDPLFETFLERTERDYDKWFDLLFGVPGAVIGFILGSLVLASISVYKGISNTFNSWLSFSGSLLNGSLQVPLFNGLGADERSNPAKIAGGLGYVLALVTTLPLSFVVFTFKSGLPPLLGALFSLPVAVVKLFKIPFKKPRFSEEDLPSEIVFTDAEGDIPNDAEASDITDTVNKFKNLYGLFNYKGEFPENTAIKDNQSGSKGRARFVTKAFDFNRSELTEVILGRALKACRASGSKKVFFEDGGQFDEILEDVKKQYNSTRLSFQYDKEKREEQIDAIGAFVKDYQLSKVTATPGNIYSNPKRSWSAAFWGPEPILRQPEELVVGPSATA